jgi:hypothetical protein
MCLRDDRRQRRAPLNEGPFKNGLLNEQGRNDKWEGESALGWKTLKRELFRQLSTLRDL